LGDAGARARSSRRERGQAFGVGVSSRRSRGARPRGRIARTGDAARSENGRSVHYSVSRGSSSSAQAPEACASTSR